jgi:hypothetical protein
VRSCSLQLVRPRRLQPGQVPTASCRLVINRNPLCHNNLRVRQKASPLRAANRRWLQSKQIARSVPFPSRRQADGNEPGIPTPTSNCDLSHMRRQLQVVTIAKDFAVPRQPTIISRARDCRRGACGFADGVPPTPHPNRRPRKFWVAGRGDSTSISGKARVRLRAFRRAIRRPRDEFDAGVNRKPVVAEAHNGESAHRKGAV